MKLNAAKRRAIQPNRTTLAARALNIGLALVITTLAFFPSRVTAAQAAPSLTFTYTLDRSQVPALNYNDVTLKIWVGAVDSLEASADGQTLPVRYDPQTGYALVSTSADGFALHLTGAADSPRLGEAAPTALKNGYAWAWSHSFDDNTSFKEYGIPAFEEYGWRATVYVIGSKLDPTRDEDWIIDVPDLVRLARSGWGIGNHTWTHTSVANMGGAEAAQADIRKLDETLQQVMAQAGRSDTRLTAFAAPAFDADYLPLILKLRDSGRTGLLFDESGSAGILRVDAKTALDDDGPFPAFSYDDAVGRDIRIDYFGSGDEREQAFRADIAAMTALLDEDHHFWLNTFTHGVDKSYPDGSIFAFLPWLHENYGPGGGNSVWVAPAEEIYSYLLVRDRIRVSEPTKTGETIQPDAKAQPDPSVEPAPAPAPTAAPPRGPAAVLDWIARLFASLFPARSHPN